MDSSIAVPIGDIHVSIEPHGRLRGVIERSRRLLDRPLASIEIGDILLISSIGCHALRSKETNLISLNVEFADDV
jgi:hypothetical protein